MRQLLSFYVMGIVVLAVLMSMPVTGKAQCPWVNRTAGAMGPCYFYSGIPNLTDEQQNGIDALRTDYWKELDKTRTTLLEDRQTLRQLRAEKDVDLKRVNKLIDEINDLEAAMAKRQVKYREDVRKLLTEDQKTYFDNLGSRAVPVRGARPGRGLGPCGRWNG